GGARCIAAIRNVLASQQRPASNSESSAEFCPRARRSRSAFSFLRNASSTRSPLITNLPCRACWLDCQHAFLPPNTPPEPLLKTESDAHGINIRTPLAHKHHNL